MEITKITTTLMPQKIPTDISELAKKLEATFVAEMLKVMQPSTEDSSFSGGIGEEQFQSFLLEQRASAIVDKGGLGLAEYFVKSLGE